MRNHLRGPYRPQKRQLRAVLLPEVALRLFALRSSVPPGVQAPTGHMKRADRFEDSLGETCKVGSQTLRPDERLTSTHDSVCETERSRFMGVNRSPCQNHIERGAVANESWQPDSAPSTSGTPHRRQNTPKIAVSEATRRSHHKAQYNLVAFEARKPLRVLPWLLNSPR
jgi:hypothetical protein